MVVLCEREAFRVTTLTDEEIKEEMMSVLRGIYGNNIPNATGVLTERWSHDPLFYGSFTNQPYQFDEKMMYDLKRPLGRLYFAGEAYHNDHDGYTHGAYLSAEEQVYHVLHCMAVSCTERTNITQ